MQTLDQKAREIVETVDVNPPTNQDYKNKASLLNHWIQDSAGRATFRHLSNNLTVDPEWVQANLESVAEIIKVRKRCEKCDTNDQRNCEYYLKQVKRVQKYEEEEGLEPGTVTPDNCFCNDFWWPNGHNSRAESYLTISRPTLLHRKKWVFGYEKCPVAYDPRED